MYTSPLALALRWIALAALIAFLNYVVAKALFAGFDQSDFPESLAIKVALLPQVFPAHMVSGALALVMMPVALALRRKRRWHRLAGRWVAGMVLISGLTAFPVALVAPVTRGSAIGFCAQATVWLVLLVLGLVAIAQGRIARHRAMMLMMVATTSGAVLFRIFLALWAIYGSWRGYARFYAADAFVAWLLPLCLCALWLRCTAAGRKLLNL